MTEFDYKIPLFDGYELEIEASPSVTTYIFLNPKGRRVKELKSKDSPLSIGPMTAIGKEIIKHLEVMDGKLRTKYHIEKEIEEILTQVDEFVEEILDAKAAAEEDAAKIDESITLDKISEGIEILAEEKNPLMFIANHIDWYTAGERMNILYAFLAYASQIVLKEPISVIAIGEGGSGKTHIEEVALSLMPSEYILNMKAATEAATYFMSESDPYYFDGKIVNMGDMGGMADHEEAHKFKNLMKELQSDGYAKRIKQVRNEDGGDHTNKEYELFGKPCITYTSVPGHDFDDQEMSRSIMLTPRMDNDIAVSTFKHLSSSKKSRTARLIESKREAIPKIQNIILALRDRMNDVEIKNPYITFIEKFLNESNFFKRDIDKYNGILRIITAINGFNRRLHRVDGYDTLFTTKEDIIIFIDILEQYHSSIVMNLSPSAKNLYARIAQNRTNLDLYEEGFTVQDYIEVSEDKLSKRSIQKYFGELSANNILKPVAKEGYNNIYVVIKDMEEFEDLKKHIKLGEKDVKHLAFDYDIMSAEDFYSMFPYTPPGDIKKCSDPPYWNDFLPE